MDNQNAARNKSDASTTNDEQTLDENMPRRGVLKGIGTTAAAVTGLGAMTGTASARARTNREVQDLVALDFEVWNGDRPLSDLNRIYHPAFHRHATIFTGPAFDDVMPGVSGLRRWGYKQMVRAMRSSVKPLSGNNGNIIFPADPTIQRQNPRSRGEWYIEGRVNGRYVYEEGRGVHTWAGGKVTRVEAYDFDFGRFLDKSGVPNPF